MVITQPRGTIILTHLQDGSRDRPLSRHAGPLPTLPLAVPHPADPGILSSCALHNTSGVEVLLALVDSVPELIMQHVALRCAIFVMDLARGASVFLNCDDNDDDVPPPAFINCGSSQRGAERGTYCLLQERENMYVRYRVRLQKPMTKLGLKLPENVLVCGYPVTRSLVFVKCCIFLNNGNHAKDK